MSLKIKIVRDPDQDISMIMTYFILYGVLRFLVRQICPGLVAVRDNEHAIEIEEYLRAQE